MAWRLSCNGLADALRPQESVSPDRVAMVSHGELCDPGSGRDVERGGDSDQRSSPAMPNTRTTRCDGGDLGVSP